MTSFSSSFASRKLRMRSASFTRTFSSARVVAPDEDAYGNTYVHGFGDFHARCAQSRRGNGMRLALYHAPYRYNTPVSQSPTRSPSRRGTPAPALRASARSRLQVPSRRLAWHGRTCAAVASSDDPHFQWLRTLSSYQQYSYQSISI